MKVLFTDITDGTLFCLMATAVGYDPESHELWFTGDEHEVVIQEIGMGLAHGIINELFFKDSLNLCAHPAYINEDPPGRSEPTP